MCGVLSGSLACAPFSDSDRSGVLMSENGPVIVDREGEAVRWSE